MTTATPSPLTATELVDEYFIENRNRLLELASFLDRIDRTDPSVAMLDFRMRALRDAVTALAGADGARVMRIQMRLSDPTTDLRPALDRKGAVGAFDASR